MKDNLTEDQVDSYREKSLEYINGLGPVLQDWVKPPSFDENWLSQEPCKNFNEVMKAQLYPFNDTVSDEAKLRILLVQRFTCLLADYELSHEHIVSIEDWMREILNGNSELKAAVCN